MSTTEAKVADLIIGRDQPMAVVAGPCVIESRDHTLRMADEIARICNRLDVPLIYKASFDKANRTSVDSFRGPGLDRGLEIFAEIKREMNLTVTTDIHTPEQATPVAQMVDCIQIPAFLCRQTDLVVAAAATGRCVSVKKGQFMSPEEMGNVVHKITSQGNRNVLLIERGTFFGYNRLVNDMTAIPRMQTYAPVVFDATHSCQLPGGAGTQSGGIREHVATLAAAGCAAGSDALFIEVHDNPDAAQSDAATQWPLERFEELLTRCTRIRQAAQKSTT